MRALLILGCEGRQDKGFHFCHGVENTIVDFEKWLHKENYLDLIKYLDGVPKLFDAPCCVHNIITNAVYKVYDMGFLTEHEYDKISHFYKMHLFCGLVLKIVPKD